MKWPIASHAASEVEGTKGGGGGGMGGRPTTWTATVRVGDHRHRQVADERPGAEGVAVVE